jgi:hypothetical protein
MSDEAPPDGPKDDNARSAMQEIAQLVDERLPRGWGFFVLACPTNGEPGRINYVSNLPRNSVIKVMKDQIKRFKDGVSFKHIPDKGIKTKECLKHGCNKARLIFLNKGKSLQTQNGFLTAGISGYYCPVCSGSYGAANERESE